MARYIGPKTKFVLLIRYSKKSEYDIQLQEKQKLKYKYGVLERQFKKTFNEAVHKHCPTGVNLMQLQVLRIDNTIYRLGLASTRAGARQLIIHKHVLINDRVVNIPSYILRVGDIIEIRERSKNLESIQIAQKASRVHKYGWLHFDKSYLKGSVVNLPDVEDVIENVKVQLVVELFSRH
ncbi:MAG: 30S ribosomal protein S4 [Solitalea-like symbiont of Acarus siro]